MCAYLIIEFSRVIGALTCSDDPVPYLFKTLAGRDSARSWLRFSTQFHKNKFYSIITCKALSRQFRESSTSSSVEIRRTATPSSDYKPANTREARSLISDSVADTPKVRRVITAQAQQSPPYNSLSNSATWVVSESSCSGSRLFSRPD